MAEEYDYLFKSIVVGDGGVGKTALTLRFSKGFFTEDYKMTIGVDFHVKTINIDANEGPIRAKLQIWDTGGQERFSSIRPMYYRGSLGALLIFDLTNSSSFDHLPQWIEEVRTNVKIEIPLLLVGNKSDLMDQRAVSLEEINRFTNAFNLFYMETSAKTGEGVGDCFYILACLMIGSGVPDQLISNGVVYSPGHVPVTTSETVISTPTNAEADFEYAAPPVPEPISIKQQKPEQSFQEEPEFEYEIPPIPEKLKPSSTLEDEFEPEIPIPKPQSGNQVEGSIDFEFKTPDEIIAEEQISSDQISSTTYKPKAVPFSSNVPVPAPAPQGFQSFQDSLPNASPSQPSTPFLTTQEDVQTESDSLMDYMPPTDISKKERKKLEKQKKKEEKEKKLQEEKEKQQILKEETKRVKKEKKEKSKKEKKYKAETVEAIPAIPMSPTTSAQEPSSTPSLFQALTQKGGETVKDSTTPFVPFSATKETTTQEKTNLRIIPNVADIESKPSGFTPLQPAPQIQTAQQHTSNKEIIICKQCGARLSSDYQFCNKCGAQL
ncbi:MAG: GTP-binding protein [Candidatus Thorarchaeota archaeon]